MSDTAPYPKLPEGAPRCPYDETASSDHQSAWRRCTRTAGHDGEHRMGYWVHTAPATNNHVNTPEQDELNAALQARKSDAVAQAAREGATPPALAYSAGAPDPQPTAAVDMLSDVLDWLNECELEDSDAPQMRARIRRVLDQEQSTPPQPPAQATIGPPDYYAVVREAAAQDARRIAADVTLAAARAALDWFETAGPPRPADVYGQGEKVRAQLAAAIALVDGVNARTEKVDPRDVDPRD